MEIIVYKLIHPEELFKGLRGTFFEASLCRVGDCFYQ